MLKERINTCIEAVETERSEKEKKQSLDNFKGALTDLNVVCKTIESYSASAKQLQTAGLIKDAVVTAETKEELVKAINDCGRAIKSNTLGRELVQILTSNTAQLKNEVSTAWKSSASMYSADAKGYISLIAGLTNNPLQMQQLANSFDELLNKDVSVKNIKDLKSKLDEANEVKQNFKLDKDIEKFLRKVSNHRATINDLTPEVMKWLTDKQLKDKIKVQF